MIYYLINLCYHIIGPTETQVEVRENTADLEVKLEKNISEYLLDALSKNIFALFTQTECSWLIVKTMAVWKFLLSQKSNFLYDQ